MLFSSTCCKLKIRKEKEKVVYNRYFLFFSSFDYALAKSSRGVFEIFAQFYFISTQNTYVISIALFINGTWAPVQEEVSFQVCM